MQSSRLHGLCPCLCLAAAAVRETGKFGFRHWSSAKRRNPIEVRSRLHDFGYGSRPRLPSTPGHTILADSALS